MDENNKRNEEEIILNNETIFEFLRREKNRDELQKLCFGFYDKVNGLIDKSKHEINVKKRDVTEFYDDNLKKMELKLDSFIKIAKELYEKRERKITTMAIIKSKTNAKLIDVANLESFEKELFDNLVNMLNYYKNKSINAFNKETNQDLINNISKFDNNNQITNNFELKTKENTINNETNNAINEPKKNITLRFINFVPKFLDKELNVLGPFEQDEIASIPYDIAQLLLKKGRAEKIDI
jgi:DNA replication initiation complex subunit (GINS family)